MPTTTPDSAASVMRDAGNVRWMRCVRSRCARCSRRCAPRHRRRGRMPHPPVERSYPMTHPPSSPHEARGRVMTYTLAEGWQVFVGRTDADNDYLSFRVARPEDWWLHVRGMSGSHVILQGPPGADPDRQTLIRAAAIA